MTHFRIVGWNKYQHYKDRNPPWIKLHRDILTSRTWVGSDDKTRTLAIALMLLAAATENKIPMDPPYLKRVAYLNAIPNIQPLFDLGFIEVIDSIECSSKCEQEIANARTETETETEKKIHALTYSIEFLRFWEVYPKKKSKGDAWKAWCSLKITNGLVDPVMGGLERAKRSSDWLKSGGQFIPYPASWLRDRGWEDEPNEPQRHVTPPLLPVC